MRNFLILAFVASTFATGIPGWYGETFNNSFVKTDLSWFHGFHQYGCRNVQDNKVSYSSTIAGGPDLHISNTQKVTCLPSEHGVTVPGSGAEADNLASTKPFSTSNWFGAGSEFTFVTRVKLSGDGTIRLFTLGNTSNFLSCYLTITNGSTDSILVDSACTYSTGMGQYFKALLDRRTITGEIDSVKVVAVRFKNKRLKLTVDSEEFSYGDTDINYVVPAETTVIIGKTADPPSFTLVDVTVSAKHDYVAWYKRELTLDDLQKIVVAGAPNDLVSVSDDALVLSAFEDTPYTILAESFNPIASPPTQSFTLAVVDQPVKGTISDELIYTGEQDFFSAKDCSNEDAADIADRIAFKIALRTDGCDYDACLTKPITVSLCVQNVNDKPVAVSATAEVNFKSAVKIELQSQDIDADNEPMEFTIQPGFLGEFKVIAAESDCDTTLIFDGQPGDLHSAATGSLFVCYSPSHIENANGGDGENVIGTDELKFKVKDLDGSESDAGTISINVLNPILGCRRCDVSGEEDQATEITLTGEDVRRFDPGSVSAYTFRITKFEGPGEFRLSQDPSSKIEVDTPIKVASSDAATGQLSTPIYYIPEPNYFNRGPNGEEENLRGEAMPEALNLTYVVRLDKAVEEESGDNVVSLFVKNAIDKISTISGPTSITLTTSEYTGMPSAITVEDIDFDTREVILRLASPQVRFRSKVEDYSDLGILKPYQLCFKTGCGKVIEFKGIPTNISSIVDSIEMLASQSTVSSDAKIVVSVLGSETDQVAEGSLQIPFTVKEEDTGSNATDIITIVLASAASVVFLIGLSATYFVYKQFRPKKRSYSSDSDSDSDDDDEEQQKRTRVAKKRTNQMKKSKNKGELAVDESIFDWEKHLDKRTGDVYFFNPKTGQSSWDPPKVTLRKK